MLFETYAILAEDFDYKNPTTNDYILNARKKGQHVPYDIPEVVSVCGSFQATCEKDAIRALEIVKENYPNIKFVLYKGATFGSLKYVVNM